MHLEFYLCLGVHLKRLAERLGMFNAALRCFYYIGELLAKYIPFL